MLKEAEERLVLALVFEQVVAVEVLDSYGASAQAQQTIRVTPYVAAANVSLAADASAILEDASSSGDVQQVGLLVQALAEQLNSLTRRRRQRRQLAAGNAPDSVRSAAEARQVLVGAIRDITSTYALSRDARL